MPAAEDEQMSANTPSSVSRMQNSSPQVSPRSFSSNLAGRRRRDDESMKDGESEPEGEDLDENLQGDYRAIPELDRYEGKNLDNEEYDNIDMNDRRVAEREMRKRDIEENRRMGRVPKALMDQDDDEDGERPRRRRRINDDGERMDDDDEGTGFVNLEDYSGPLREWLTQEKVRSEIRRRFRLFLTSFVADAGEEAFYPKCIINMCSQNKASLEVSYLHLSTSVPTLAIYVADAPAQMLELFDQEAQRVTMTLFRDYDKIHANVHVRIKDLPIVDSLRDLRALHLNALIKVQGVVTRRTPVFPQLSQVYFNCAKCGFLMGPYYQTGAKEVNPGSCPECQSSGPFKLNVQQTVYRNYQRITLQESPGSVPAGRIPRQKDVVLQDDLIDTCRPGEEIELTGVYESSFDVSLNKQQGFPVFSTVIMGNYIAKQAGDMERSKLNDSEIKEITKLSKRPDIGEVLFNSIGPSVYGHANIKKCIALSMFGGCRKNYKEQHRIRGDINVLILGDPGTAKSQFLKYIEKTSHRAVYTTGKGASAVGLTATVRRDPMTQEWTLEGGALVLADQGMCLIDEFDKMNEQDRTSIHEAMEQQSISVSKAGIITTLQARCAVVAAANPNKGRYDTRLSFAENIDLTDAILSRFDCLCVVRDTVDAVHDEMLAGFVVESHMGAHPDDRDGKKAGGGEEDAEAKRKAEEERAERARNMQHLAEKTIPQDLLKKYILYARQTCKPKVTHIDDDRIAKLYSELRRESMNSGGIPIAVRHIESMIRMSEAHAKMHLREFVNSDDINMSISIMLDSFISTQKFSVKRTLQRHFQSYLNFKQDSFQLLLFTLREFVSEAVRYNSLNNPGNDEDFDPYAEPIEISCEDFEQKARDLDIPDVTSFYKSDLFKGHHFAYSKGAKKITFTKPFSI